MATYQSIPVKVDAMQVTLANYTAVGTWLGAATVQTNTDTASGVVTFEFSSDSFGIVEAFVNWWIFIDDSGNVQALDNDSFLAAYAPVV